MFFLSEAHHEVNAGGGVAVVFDGVFDVALINDHVAGMEECGIFAGADFDGSVKDGEVFLGTGVVCAGIEPGPWFEGEDVEFEVLGEGDRGEDIDMNAALVGVEGGDVLLAVDLEFADILLASLEHGIEIESESIGDLPGGGHGGVDLAALDL